MSKSDPNSAIFMEDSEQEVKTKIKKAFCPPQQVRTAGALTAAGPPAGAAAQPGPMSLAGPTPLALGAKQELRSCHGMPWWPGCPAAVSRPAAAPSLLQVAGNPCLSYVQHIVLPWCERFEVERSEANGGSK